MSTDRSPPGEPESSHIMDAKADPDDQLPQQVQEPQAQLDPPAQDDVSVADGNVTAKAEVKIPPFTREQPGKWFAKVEATFDLQGITSDVSKFNYVVDLCMRFDPAVVTYALDLVITPPDHDKYPAFKRCILESLSDVRLRELLRKLLATNSTILSRSL